VTDYVYAVIIART